MKRFENFKEVSAFNAHVRYTLTRRVFIPGSGYGEARDFSITRWFPVAFVKDRSKGRKHVARALRDARTQLRLMCQVPA